MGFDLAAIETDIFTYEDRVQAVVAITMKLETENYYDIERNARKDNVPRLCNFLLELIKTRRSRLELSLQLQLNLHEMSYIFDSMEELVKVEIIEGNEKEETQDETSAP